MIKAIINGLLKLIMSILNVFLLPINLLFENLFPDMTNALGTFNTFINTYVGGTLSYFFSILPPIFRGLLVIWFTFLISYYTIYYTYHGLIKIWGIIQKIKFW